MHCFSYSQSLECLQFWLHFSLSKVYDISLEGALSLFLPVQWLLLIGLDEIQFQFQFNATQAVVLVEDSFKETLKEPSDMFFKLLFLSNDDWAMIAFSLLCLTDTRSCFYFDFNLHGISWLSISCILFFFVVFFCGISYVHSFIPTEHLWNQTLSRGGKVSANHNSEPFETTKTRYSLHRFQNSVFHGSGRKKGSLCCESPNKEIKSLSECRCHIVRSGRAENSFLQCVGWLHIK